MNYNDLVEVLKSNSQKELVFLLGNGTIRRGYHITEVFKASIHSIDCGGEVERRSETVFQLLEPSNSEGSNYMLAESATSILEKSHQKIDIDQDSTVILEFRPRNGEGAQRYHVSDIKVLDDHIHVVSTPTATQCKAALRPQKTESSACCSTSRRSKNSENRSACCPPATS